MSKFCYYDHSSAADSLLEVAREFLNKPYPDDDDLRMCSGLVNALRIVTHHKNELATSLQAPTPLQQVVEEDTVEAFGA